MIKSNHVLIAGLMILGLSMVTASLSLDEALNYSLQGKTCKDVEQVTIDKEYIDNYLKKYQSIESVRAEIDLLKQVRELILKAKASIIRVDAGFVSFIQTENYSQLQNIGYDDILDLIETMETTTDPVDKVQLCDDIVQKINELIAWNEELIKRDDYELIPTKLQSKLDAINSYLKKCKSPEFEPGSVKIEDLTPAKDDHSGSITITYGGSNGGDDNGSVVIDDKQGSVEITKNPNDENGSVAISDAKPEDPVVVPPVNTGDNNGSVKIENGSNNGGNDGGSVTPTPTPSGDNNGSVQIDNGSNNGGNDGGSVTPTPTPSTDNNGSVQIDNGSNNGGNDGGSVTPTPTPTTDTNGSVQIDNGSNNGGNNGGSVTPTPTPSDDTNGSLQISGPQLQSVSTGTLSFVQNKITTNKKSNIRKHKKQARMDAL